ncbi:hypothetical protein N9251_02180 [Gammaproteobacteria bacterium]|nr:hypothetical protein [Gammaproteobacteria bacterium]
MTQPNYTLNTIGDNLFSACINKTNSLIELYDKLHNSSFITEYLTNNWDTYYPFFKKGIHTAILEIKQECDEIFKQMINNKDNGIELDSLFKKLSPTYQGNLPEFRKINPRLILHKNKSWIRVYSIKLPNNIFIITGGAIKVTQAMQDAEWTNQEWIKLNTIKEFILNSNLEALLMNA